jgi:predicted DNA-binding transcriptional regulator YafY
VLDLKLADHSDRREQVRAIQQALFERRCLSGEYRSPYRAEVKKLILHPYRLCLLKQAWYLIARPEGAEHPATYRVARFGRLEVLDAPARIPEDFDLRAYFGNAWAVYRGERTFDVEVRFTRDAAAIVTETTWHRTQRVHHHEDGSVTLAFRVDGLEEITHWLVGWAGFVQILRPEELRERVSERWRKGLALNVEVEGVRAGE